MQKLIDSVKLAKKLNFPLVNCHPGAVEKQPQIEKCWGWMIGVFKKAVKLAEKNNIKISIECMEEKPKEFVKEPEQLLRIIDSVGSPNLGITFDIIHAYTHGEERPLKYFHEFKHKVFHVHISGHSKAKTHVPFAQTQTPKGYIEDFLKQIIKEYHDILSVEGAMNVPKEEQLKIIKDNIRFLRKIFP